MLLRHTFTLSALLLVSLTSVAALAQEAAEEAAPKVPTLGGNGHLAIGEMLGRVNGTGFLSGPNAFGAGGSPGNNAWTLGGGGRVLIGHLLIGGKGFGYTYDTFTNDSAEIAISGGGGGFDIGYALLLNADRVVYPFFGLGGMAINMEVTNRNNLQLHDGDFIIGAGETNNYEAGFAYAELGMGGQWFIPGAAGGAMLGFELGGLFQLSGSPWSQDGQELAGLGKAGINGAYLRLMVGGGGFFLE